jgi:hypothetical protein
MSIGKGSMPVPDLVWQGELAQQFVHADPAGTLTRELALTLAEVALSYAKGHPFPPPADFAPDWDDADHLNDRSYYD